MPQIIVRDPIFIAGLPYAAGVTVDVPQTLGDALVGTGEAVWVVPPVRDLNPLSLLAERGVFAGVVDFGPGGASYSPLTTSANLALTYETSATADGSEVAVTIIGAGHTVNFGSATNIGTTNFDPVPGRVNVFIFRFQAGRVLYNIIHQFDLYTYLTWTGLTATTFDAASRTLTFTGGQGNAIATQTFGTVDGSYIAWQVTNPTINSGIGVTLWLDSDTTNPEAWGVKQHAIVHNNGGRLYTHLNGTQAENGGTGTVQALEWWRLRVSGESLVYERASDYSSWVVIRTESRTANTINVKGMHLNATAGQTLRNAHIFLP
jgi:hypothetical protein